MVAFILFQLLACPSCLISAIQLSCLILWRNPEDSVQLVLLFASHPHQRACVLISSEHWCVYVCVRECGSSRVFLEGRAVLSFRGERRPRWHLSLRARPLSPSSLPPSLAMQSPLTEPRNYKHRRMSSTPSLSVFQDVLIVLSFRSLLSLCSGKCVSKSLLCLCLWLGQV